MDTNNAIRLARQHVADNADNISSARMCLADAIAEYDAGNLRAAYRWAVRSLAYSVGVFGRDYQRVAR